MSKLSLRWRSILPIALILLIGFSAMIGVIAINASQSYKQVTDMWVEGSAKSLSNTLNAGLTSAVSVLRGLAPSLQNDIESGTANREVWIKVLEDLIHEQDSIYAAYIYIEPNAFDGKDAEYSGNSFYDASGIFAPYVTARGVRLAPLSEHQQYGYYQLVRAKNGEIITDPYLLNDTDGSQVMTASAAMPVIVDDRFVGFIAADYRFSDLDNELTGYRALRQETSYGAVVGANGMFAAHRDSVHVGTNAFQSTSAATQEALREAFTSGSTQIFEGASAHLGGIPAYFAIVPFEVAVTGTRMACMVAVSSADVFWPVTMGIAVAAIISVVVFITTLIVLYVMINGSLKSITFLNDQLSVSTQSVLSASSQIAASSEVLAQGGVQQAASTEETSATMSETAAQVQTNAENTRQALDLSEAATNASEEGHKRVSELIASMEELSRSSDEISKIIKIIDDIAFQTNILALNAAVEAARAGDAGRGFAVVAEEVRNLAQQSAEAASRTSRIIEDNLQLSRRGVDSSMEVGSSLRNISERNSEVNSIMEQINNASEEEARGIQQVHIALSQMEDVTQSNAAVAEESSAASAELEKQARDLEALAMELAHVVLGSGSVASADDRSSIISRRAPSHSQAGQEQQPIPQLTRGSTTPRGRIVSPNEVIPLEKDNPF